MASAGTIIVTGSNGGLGSAIVENILSKPDLASNYTGVYAVRKAATATKLQAALSKAPPDHKHETIELDLGSLADVRKVAADINARVAKGDLPRIRALILNAGYQDHGGFAMSEDGFEMSWQVNFLSNMLLSLLLLQSMDTQEGRILVIGSWAHNMEDTRNNASTAYKDPRYPTLYPGVEALAKGQWSRPEDDPSSNSGFRRYGASKLCVIMFCQELANRIAKDPKLSNVSVIGLDPGGMPTDIARRAGFLIGSVVMKVVVPIIAAISVRINGNGMFRPAWKSAADVVRACFEIDPHRGELLHLDGTVDLEIAKEARDEAKRKEVWEYGLKAARIEEGDTALADWK
ncbi:NAD(P)-binding protein [Trichoderma citrinoviride]|uniref:NAD(P)-binding protein n=1 Tax=Trichoderma citrinoviride TaxID=58853 RepID=A0A2T4BCJ7_9HYPO|nr:NAD(P)-binding protein [Trichoderma citrinoviride]PTB67052.1 NAD(P)-binding protein [Trichoderma citrinoviride]